MKKTMLFISVIALYACATTTSEPTGITRLKQEPKNCEYLYNVDTTMTSYNINDAYEFLEKRIIEQDNIGDSYYISGEDVLDNTEAIFGPKHTFKLKAKVYNCNK